MIKGLLLYGIYVGSNGVSIGMGVQFSPFVLSHTTNPKFGIVDLAVMTAEIAVEFSALNDLIEHGFLDHFFPHRCSVCSHSVQTATWSGTFEMKLPAASCGVSSEITA
jgi:hypothetical protein